MDELLTKFKSQWDTAKKDLVELSKTWYELSQFDGARERVKRELGITDKTLDALEKIHAGLLYPPVVLQSRGLLRLEKMSYDDQLKLFDEGIEVLVNGIVTKLKYNQMSNQRIVQAITTQGRIKPADEQKEASAKPKTSKPPYEFSSRGIRFTRNVTLTVTMLLSIVQAYRKWRPSSGKRR